MLPSITKKARKAIGNVKSIMSKSFVKRFRMRPIGVVSKKDIGAWTIRSKFRLKIIYKSIYRVFYANQIINQFKYFKINKLVTNWAL